MPKKSLIMFKKCTYNSLHITHYAQGEPTIMLTETNMRLSYAISSATISVLPTIMLKIMPA